MARTSSKKTTATKTPLQRINDRIRKFQTQLGNGDKSARAKLNKAISDKVAHEKKKAHASGVKKGKATCARK